MMLSEKLFVMGLVLYWLDSDDSVLFRKTCKAYFRLQQRCMKVWTVDDSPPMWFRKGVHYLETYKMNMNPFTFRNLKSLSLHVKCDAFWPRGRGRKVFKFNLLESLTLNIGLNNVSEWKFVLPKLISLDLTNGKPCVEIVRHIVGRRRLKYLGVTNIGFVEDYMAILKAYSNANHLKLLYNHRSSNETPVLVEVFEILSRGKCETFECNLTGDARGLKINLRKLVLIDYMMNLGGVLPGSCIEELVYQGINVAICSRIDLRSVNPNSVMFKDSSLNTIMRSYKPALRESLPLKIITRNKIKITCINTVLDIQGRRGRLNYSMYYLLQDPGFEPIIEWL